MKCSLFYFASGTSLFAHIIAQHSLSLYVPILSGFTVGEDCVTFVAQKHYINSWLARALSRNEETHCACVRGCVKCIKQTNDGWGRSPWNRRGSCCCTRREERRDSHGSFIHTEGSGRWDWLSHTASASAQTSAQPWWDSQSRHASSDRWGWPEDICSTRAAIGWQGWGRLQWKCQEFVQRQQPPRVPHLQRAVRLVRRSPHHLTQLWPRAVPPLYSWDHEAGQGPGPAEVPLLSTDHAPPGVGDQEDAGGVIQRGSLRSRAGPRHSPRPWTAGRPSSGEAAGDAHGHLRMLSLPCQRMEVDAATLPLPLHHCSPAAAPGVAGLPPVHGCSSHYAVQTFLITTRGSPEWFSDSQQSPTVRHWRQLHSHTLMSNIIYNSSMLLT